MITETEENSEKNSKTLLNRALRAIYTEASSISICSF